MQPFIPIALVFIGCCCSVVFLELLVTEHQGSGNLIIFSQFLFITAEGFVFTMKCGRKKPAIPLMCYIKMTSMYAITVLFQTILLHFQVGIPLQQLLRSGSLIANLILGVVILKKRYKISKYVSILMITLGIIMATTASANSQSNNPSLNIGSVSGRHSLMNWCLGILVFAFVLLVTALMGIYQEIVFGKYGKHAAEALYFNHMLPLPVFLFFLRDLFRHADLFTYSGNFYLPMINISLPRMWIYLLGNVISQFVCLSSVFTLTAECSSLTVTLVVTLRKFLSLLFSIIYFNNSFTIYHWIGTVLVFSGTLLFADVFPSRWKMSQNDVKRL